MANAKFRPDQITNTKSSALFVEEEEEEETVKPNVMDKKIGFRDNRVGWLRFESIHLRKSLGEMRKETSEKYWFSKSVWRIRLLNKRAFCQGDTWQAR